VPAAIQLTAGNGHFRAAAELCLFVESVHVQRFFDPAYIQLGTDPGKVCRAL
jgi:hypothetical protein